MFGLSRDNDSICALSTPRGVGAISVVRISGSSAIVIARKIAPFLPSELESHRAYYGICENLIEPSDLDEVIVTFFAKGRSFTGEDTLEFSCHGSPIISQLILQNLIFAGGRLADKGEFTYRAFSSGRIDLAQAESVLMLIESQSKKSAKQALRHLKGELSNRYSELEDLVIWILSRLEANLDFSSEDIEIESNSAILIKMESFRKLVDSLLNSFKKGRIFKEGLRVVIAGAPNVGKSSLLNFLADDDRAIVSEYAGTTRDAIEVELDLSGHKVILVDTAGIRNTNDPIEKLGIERSKGHFRNADVLIRVKTPFDSDFVIEDLILPPEIKILSVVNKMDLQSDYSSDADEICCSTVDRFGKEKIIFELEKILTECFNEDSPSVMATRQFELLSKIEKQILVSIELMKDEASPEFIIAELTEVVNSVLELTGRRFDDQVLDRVFKDFCLGK